VAVVALLAGFLVAQFTPAQHHGVSRSLFTAALVDLPMFRLIDRKSASKESKESAPELLTEVSLAETPAQQP
jgi:hypothetical protein